MIAFRISVNEHRMERSVQNMRPRSYGTAGKILRLHKGEIPMFDSNHVFLGIAPIGWCNDDMPELGGENTIALGSDFDGADIPGYLDSVEKVDNLYDALLADGLGKELAEKILFGNAYNFIRNNLK